MSDEQFLYAQEQASLDKLAMEDPAALIRAIAGEGPKSNGGPAFPAICKTVNGVPMDCGMSLRDYFAAKADSADIVIILHEHYEEWRKTGVLEGYQQPTRQQARYMHADLMLAERAK
jgi:hypothetical protein